MTKSKGTKLRVTDRGFKTTALDPAESSLYRVLKIFKARETTTMPIFYPNPKYFGSHKKGVTAENIQSLVKIEANLLRGKYTTRPWNFIRDVNEAFDFIKSQHTKKTIVFGKVCEYQSIFSAQMDTIMQDLGYCCGHWQVLEPRSINCNGNGVKTCVIPVGSLYYRYGEWTYCLSCFKAFEQDLVKLDEETLVSKSQFHEYFFEGSRVEDFVRCCLCKRKNHEICVLHLRITGEPFYCQQCRELHNIEKIPVRAASLPQTDCDIFIDNFLKSHDINKDDTLTTRLLSDMEHVLKVKKVIKDFRRGPDQYQFRNCTLFTFFDTGLGTDICFFSVFFQLYGSDCHGPNRNTAYISYIDSVNLLPSAGRTKIYRLILLGLFEYLKTKGYVKIYLWSCPPRQNQDYIFYMKPPKMKMPTKERLSRWYVDLFKLGKDLRVIESYVGVQQHAEAENWKSVSDIPYMDGDLWLTRIEEAATTVQRDSTKLQKEAMSLRLRVDEARKSKKNETKKLKEMKTRLEKKLTELQNSNKNANLWKMMNVQIRGFNSEYFVIHLTSGAAEVEEVKASESIERIWLNDRSALVDFLWEFMLEFSSERRAQFSTYMLLYRIFAQSRICVRCSKTVEGLNGSLLCEFCHKKDSLNIPRHLEVPDELLRLNLTPTVNVIRCRIFSSVQNEHNYAMDIQDGPQTQTLSRESSVTNDSGVGGSPESQPDFSSDPHIDADIHLFDSDSEYEYPPSSQRRCRQKSYQDLSGKNHFTRSKTPSKKFDKPEIVAFVPISDAED